MANVYQSVLDAGGSTPTSITPSNSSPAFMSSGGTYQPTANGYAIESYSSKTPSDSTPPSVSSGDIVKMGGAGYLYENQQSGWQHIATAYDSDQSGTTFVLSGFTVGKKYHLFTTCGGGSAANALDFSKITPSSGATDFSDDSIQGAASGSVYSGMHHNTFKATSTTITFSKSNSRRLGYMLFVE